jgi:hypothetical protein
VSSVEMEVEEGTTEERNVPYPISREKAAVGWDSLVNKCWLQCDACNRWRNAPKAVRNAVSFALPHASHPSRGIAAMG